MISGVLPLLKPRGMTSHDAVAKVRRMVRIRRIGHTGTLDPDVSGVLPLCIGQATRIVEYMQDCAKSYEAVMYIGKSTTTEDASGEIIEQVDDVKLTDEVIHDTLQQFTGTITQVPPMYSAVKHEGKRLYELARQGKEVKRKSREVVIHELKLQSIDRQDGHILVRFNVICSKGTYVRTLCVDIGKTLGYPAMMYSLQRTGSGNLSLDDCYTLEQLQEAVESDNWSCLLLPVDEALDQFPSVNIVDGVWDKKARNGLKIPFEFACSVDVEGPIRMV